MSDGRWLVLEPYYGGSHRHLVDGLEAELGVPIELYTLPPRKWKWRMRGAALVFARRLAAERRDWSEVAGIFTSSLLDAAALRGLLPAAARTLPLVVYCHENQLRYPVQVDDKRDHHYGWTNAQSLAAADRVLWNSAYNRDSFLEELAAFVRRMPDARPVDLPAAIATRSQVVPVPFDAAGIAARTGDQTPPTGPCRIAWNHRWEHDKGPDVLFDALDELIERELEFEIAVLGESFERRPPVFDTARERLGHRVRAWGYVADRAAYERELAAADVAVSTAHHEFQGLAVLEAAAAGATPLVPNDLAYPEIWPDELRYERGTLAAALAERIEHLDRWRRRDAREIALTYDWGSRRNEWRAALDPAGLDTDPD